MTLDATMKGTVSVRKRPLSEEHSEGQEGYKAIRLEIPAPLMANGTNQ